LKTENLVVLVLDKVGMTPKEVELPDLLREGGKSY
jgi:hypothetical protein